MLLRICWLFLLAQTCALGQDGWGIVFPTCNQIDVSPSTSIIVRSAVVIDTAQWRIRGLPILVVRDSIARAVPRSSWNRHRISGTVSLVDETTYSWTPLHLLPKTTYRCVTEDDERIYTTASDVPSVVRCNVGVPTIQCTTPIEVIFTSPLPQTCPVDSVVVIEQLHQSGMWVRSSTTLELDGQFVRALPLTHWETNSQLRVRVRCSWYAGDIDLDRTYESMVRGATSLVCTARITTQSADDEALTNELSRNNKVLLSGDTAYVDAPRFVAPNKWFSHWESSSFPGIHRDTSASIAFVVGCESMQRECRISAVYHEVDSLRVVIEADSLGGVDVYSDRGELLGAYTRPAVVTFSATNGPLVCVAKPNRNATCTGWKYQGSVIAATSIVIPTKEALSVRTVHINPRFEVLEPALQDIYRLRGSIVDIDADPLYDPSLAVSFTTPYEYESKTPATRTLCIVAQRCWEIVGYHDQATAGPVWFDDGLQEHCITAELLNPENHVVFFVRRKALDLRVEKVLLGSEDPTDIILNKPPHPETRIEVQRQQMVLGMLEWITLSSSECTDTGKQHSRYRVRCGDNIRLVVHPANHRGQQWRWWSAWPGYVVPVGKGGVQPSIYGLVVDTDLARFDASDCDGVPLGHKEIRVQAAFRQQMIIESIGMRVRVHAQGARENARFEERWFDPLIYFDTDDDEPSSGRQMEYVSRRGTPVRAKFSLPLEPLSVYRRAIVAESYDNVLLTNPHEQDLDFAVIADTTGNVNVLSSTGQYLDIIEFWICDPTTKPRRQALHTGSIDVTYSTALSSYNDTPLRSSQTFALRRMEMPGYGIKLESISVADDGDWDFWPFVNRGELYHAVYGGDLATHQAMQTEHGFTRLPVCEEQQGTPGECTQLHGDKDGPLNFGGRSLWIQPLWMAPSDLAWVCMSTWDEDCKDENDCLVNRMEDVIDSLRTRVAKYNVPIEAAALDWKALIPDLIKTGVDLIDAVVAPDDQDDFLAEGTVLEDSQTLWGMRCSQAPFMTRYHENGEYRFKGQWYTARAVVR